MHNRMEEWKALVEKTADLQRLRYEAEPGITIEPLYAPEPTALQPAFRSGQWLVEARLNASESSELEEALKGGADRLLIDIGEREPERIDSLIERADGAAPAIASDQPGPLRDWIKRSESKVDSIHMHEPTGDDIAAALPLVEGGRARRVFCISGTRHRERGATRSQEIGLMLASLVQTLRDGEQLDIPPERIAAAVELRLAVDPEFFLSIAALRALRLNWAAIAGHAGFDVSPHIVAEESTRYRTAADPWVNMLRSTTACFAGAVGGADVISLSPYDELLSEHSRRGRRMMLNTQHVAMREAWMSQVADPGAGSWFIEDATEQVARRSWDMFVSIESAGGYRQFVESGEISRVIDEAHDREMKRVARRARPITGVTEFPLRDETVPAPSADGIARRIAAPFEELRSRANPPHVFIAALGKLSENTARTNFCTNLLASGGIHHAVSDSDLDNNSIAEAYAASDAETVVVASSNDLYETRSAELVRALRRAGARRVLLAGPPGDYGSLNRSDVDGFLFAGMDVLQALDDIWKGGRD